MIFVWKVDKLICVKLYKMLPLCCHYSVTVYTTFTSKPRSQKTNVFFYHIFLPFYQQPTTGCEKSTHISGINTLPYIMYVNVFSFFFSSLVDCYAKFPVRLARLHWQRPADLWPGGKPGILPQSMDSPSHSENYFILINMTLNETILYCFFYRFECSLPFNFKIPCIIFCGVDLDFFL